MNCDRDEDRRRRALRKRQEATARLQAKLDQSRRQERNARSQLLNTTRHPTWHAHRLAYQDRQAGFDGEMSEARYYLRALPLSRYTEAITPFAEINPDAGVVLLEVAAVRANLEEWTARGKAQLYQQAQTAYVEECRSFAHWQQANPDEKDWRNQPATRAQWMLIRRTADRLNIADMPLRLKRGEAHAWLERHGANLRFRSMDAEEGSPKQFDLESKNADDNEEFKA
ncbi:hypothetical protein TomMM35A_08520 [Sphingobium sp. TomMM35A]